MTQATRRTFYFFTDGSLDGDLAGLGNTSFDSEEEAISYFSGEVPSSYLSFAVLFWRHPRFFVFDDLDPIYFASALQFLNPRPVLVK